jgi:hypothetical protein
MWLPGEQGTLQAADFARDVDRETSGRRDT